MGAVRLFLALAVALTHAPENRFYGFQPIYGNSAVEAFFVLSGFFITLVLCENRTYRESVAVFYLSRYLRLWPTYIVCIALTLILSSQMHLQAAHAPWWKLISPFTLFFQELPMFDERFGLIIMPQAWSLGIELSFYMIAPLFVRSPLACLIVLAGSLAVRIALWSYGLIFDPWAYRFFPATLTYFCLGALGYHAQRAMLTPNIVTRALGLAGITWLLLAISYRAWAAQWMPVVEVKQIVMFDALFSLSVVIALPFAFIATGKSRIDRTLGDLSYPVYLVFMLISVALTGRDWPYLNGIYVVLLLLTGVALRVVVDLPVEHVRHRYLVRRPQIAMPQPDSPRSQQTA